MRRCLVILFLVLVMSNFAVGSSYSEIETSFVVMGPSSIDSLSFWVEYGDYVVAGALVIIAVLVYLNAIKGSKRKRRK